MNRRRPFIKASNLSSGGQNKGSFTQISNLPNTNKEIDKKREFTHLSNLTAIKPKKKKIINK